MISRKLTALLLMSTAAVVISTGNSMAACLPAELCARVNNLQDVAFGSYGGAGDLTSNYTLCIYVQNDDESNYNITGTGNGPGSIFRATNGTTSISITTDFEEDSAPGWVNLVESTPTAFSNPDTVDEDCIGGGNSAKVRVTLPEAQLQSATAGSYTGRVYLEASPD